MKRERYNIIYALLGQLFLRLLHILYILINKEAVAVVIVCAIGAYHH